MDRTPLTLLLDCPGAGRTLAFGLRWHALIGSNVPALARARGRRLRASHYVVGGAPATMAGYGRVRSRRGGGWRAGFARGRGEARVQAAAQLFALLYPDGGHSLIRLPDGGHWLVAAQRGTVLSQTDRVFASLDEALREQSLLLAQRPALPMREAGAVWAALQQAVDPAARLVALPSRWAEVPLALRLFLACVGLSALAPALWSALETQWRGREAPAADGAEEGPSQPDPYLVLLQTTAAHAPSEVGRLLSGLGRLPIQVAGWALSRAQCTAEPRGWGCSAAYVRVRPSATNQALHALRPAGWELSFQPMEGATLSWQMAARQARLADLSLPTGLQVDTGLVAALQRLQPAFSAIALAAASPLPMVAPPAAQDASSQRPERPGVRRRALVLRGPLRSFALLPDAISTARWSRLSLEIRPQPRPGLAASTLIAELQGELYEQE
ncbi:hypothetical protein P3W66_10980 [Achromobacter denitrificans]|uniref:hypothetical protein n=1 Tax=Achromobacter denitrificans TaxID=32002 RepID=UPI0023E7F2BC|nr:hypothetical protein [Achromobacter denitrificans]MDF3940553.1 hypothetical protein [Achromobacter denitrificans]